MNPIRLRLIVAAFSIGFLALPGCVYSTLSFSDQTNSQPDLRLLGTWEVVDPVNPTEKKGTWVISRKVDARNVLQIVMLTLDNNEKHDLFLTKIGNEYFASLLFEDKDEKVYLLGKYEFTAVDKFKFWCLDPNFFIDAVNHEELKGSLKKHDVVLDDSSKNLQQFIRKNGDKCFSKESVLIAKQIKN